MSSIIGKAEKPLQSQDDDDTQIATMYGIVYHMAEDPSQDRYGQLQRTTITEVMHNM